MEKSKRKTWRDTGFKNYKLKFKSKNKSFKFITV